ncbi:hypothetical protein B0H17DRAFT_1207683 [Mycena rosella]|uniref:DNA 3'-5' helicase n=1 Tax=Mycena rosella TaxID=1033263 RepID=A0AAD7D324_MYCRO|nr:hypothetical protein B0H17DRAFT_1207683 [Mycena rosella]
MYHSLRSTSENEEILRLLDEDPECQVVIATIAFANGLNVKSLLDSISLGFPDTVDQLWQEKGRVGRDPETSARGVVLFQPSALVAAQKQLEAPSTADSSATKHTKAPKSKSQPKSKPLEHAKALLLTETECYNSAINRIYQNPPLETSTLDCIAAGRRLPCSLCAARNDLLLTFSAPPLPCGVELPPFVHPPTADPIAALEKKLRLTKKEHQHAESVLKEFGEVVRRAERTLGTHQHRPKSSFFPTSVIRSILNVLLTLDSLDKVECLLTSWIFAKGYQVRLYAHIHALRAAITSQRETARLERNAKQRATRQKKKKRYKSESEEESESDADEESSSEEEAVDKHPRSSPIPPPPKRARRVLREVTNKERPAPRPANKAARAGLQSAAQVAESYANPYRTTSRRRVTRD